MRRQKLCKPMMMLQPRFGLASREPWSPLMRSENSRGGSRQARGGRGRSLLLQQQQLVPTLAHVLILQLLQLQLRTIVKHLYWLLPWSLLECTCHLGHAAARCSSATTTTANTATTSLPTGHEGLEQERQQQGQQGPGPQGPQ
jgi:hypothetical protein